MGTLDHLHIVDLVGELPHAGWIIGQRPGTDSITWHWNGPPVPAAYRRGRAGVLAQLRIDARWQMRPGWGGTKNGAPHLMYHFVVDADGVIYETAPINELLWHCGHQVGNTRGLAVHFLVGALQRVTAPQIASGVALTDALRADYGILRARALGHDEWNHSTKCPGPDLRARLHTYRQGEVATPPSTAAPGCRRYRVTGLSGANVRQGPSKSFAVAGTLKHGQTIWVDSFKDGQVISGNPRWAHMGRVKNEQADLGFVSMTLLEEVR